MGIGIGTVAVGGAFAGAIPRLASAATPKSDVAILNYALTLEYLEAAFYAGARANAGIFKGDTRNFVSVVANHEAVHVAFLKKALGSAAVKKPKFDFKGTNNTNQKTFEATAQLLEDTGVSAYLGQVANIKTPAIAATSGVRQAADEGADPRRRRQDRLHRRLSARNRRRGGGLYPPPR